MTNGIAKFNDNGILLLLETFLTELRKEYFVLRVAAEVEKDEKSKIEYENCRKFIRSEYFGKLTMVDGEEILLNLDKEEPTVGLMKATRDGLRLEAKRGYGKSV